MIWNETGHESHVLIFLNAALTFMWFFTVSFYQSVTSVNPFCSTKELMQVNANVVPADVAHPVPWTVLDRK